MQDSLRIMLEAITGLTAGLMPTVYLFGSVVLDDFQSGWSDIDLLCLTEESLPLKQAEVLVDLRQALLRDAPGNPYFRSFEGGILSWEAFLEKAKEPIVYWGTSGQRITDTYCFDPFSTLELKMYGRLLYGTDHRERIPDPTREEIIEAVRKHYHTIRQYAKQTQRNLYAAGWMLDIARCLYTLKTNGIIAKTQAGKWALENGLVPGTATMRRVIEIRENPLKAKADEQTMDWLLTLGPSIQRFADVLEEWLKKG